MLKFFLRIFGDSNERVVKKLSPLVARINALEPSSESLTDSEFGEKTLEFRARLEQGESLEDLLTDVSKNDLHCEGEVQFIFSGNNEFPYNAREQWTDSCNLLALKEGVVLGYDRNDKTTEAFRNAGFRIVYAKELLQQLDAGTVIIDEISDTLILMPSAELSRARGGFHCMSLPLWREPLQ